MVFEITGLYKCECKARLEVLTVVVENSDCLGCDAMSINSYQFYEEACCFHFWGISSM